MPDAYFRISVINGALSLCRHRQQYPDLSIEDAIRQLRIGPSFLAGYDYPRAIELGREAGWDAFVVQGTRREQLQKTLKHLVTRLKPFWAQLSHLGRARVLKVLTADQLQCLDFAGLLATPPTEDVLQWWDEVGSFFRAQHEQNKLEIGREGERRTMAHETERLKKKGIPKQPLWIALEDNSAGYDILSFQHADHGKIHDLRIEVKAASYSPTHFILTRAEWDCAIKQPHLHLFHIWNLESSTLHKLSVSDMAEHMPIDCSYGEWRNVRVTLP